MKRILAFLILTVMLLGALVGCDGATQPQPSDSDESSSEAASEKGSESVKTIPVYQGMTVSKEMPNVSMLNATRLSTGGYVNQVHPFGSAPTIEKKIGESFIYANTSTSEYFARKNEDIYIIVHIENPDNFVILSFTLNGKVYSSYMFEEGSNMETLILKYNVGNVEDTQEYTIDAVKYVDGENIKDAKMAGEKTIKVNITPEKQPTATITDETVGIEEITLTATVSDPEALISESGGKLYFVLYDGDKLIVNREINSGEKIIVSDLMQEKIYQYAIVGVYDAIDGSDVCAHTLVKRSVVTKKHIFGGGDVYVTVPIEELEYDGLLINVLVRDDSRFTSEWSKESIADTDTLGAAVRDRNEQVQEELDVVPQYIYTHASNKSDYFGSFVERMKADVNFDLHEYDIAAQWGYYANSALVRNYTSNLLDTDIFPYFDFTKPCWNQSLVKNSNINGRSSVCAGDITLSVFDAANVMWMNTDLYSRLKQKGDPESIQTLVNNGGWTMSELNKWCNIAENTINGQGGTYGFYLQGEAFETISYSAKLNHMEKHNDGSYGFNVIGNLEAETALIQFRNMYFSNQNHAYGDCTENGDCFYSGELILKTGYIRSSDSDVAKRHTMGANYTLLPFPKYDENQGDYYTMARADCTLISVLDHGQSAVPTYGEEVSAFLQYSCELSRLDVREAYFGSIVEPNYFLSQKKEKEYEASAKIFNTIVDNIQFDFAWLNNDALNDFMGIFRKAYDNTDTLHTAFQDNQEQYEGLLRIVQLGLGLIVIEE